MAYQMLPFLNDLLPIARLLTAIFEYTLTTVDKILCDLALTALQQLSFLSVVGSMWQIDGRAA